MATKKPTIEDGAACAVYTEDSLTPSEIRDKVAMWFTDSREPLATAKDICNRCPVREQCLDYALENPREADHGVWGGLTQYSLKKLRKRNR